MALGKVVPVIGVEVNDMKVRALVDTGCSRTMVRSSVPVQYGGKAKVVAFDGSSVECKGTGVVKLSVEGTCVEVNVLVVYSMVAGVDVVMGMDAIKLLGGVAVGSDGHVDFGTDPVCAVSGAVDHPEQNIEHQVEDEDFDAWSDGTNWTVKWKWNCEKPPILKNQVACYTKGLEGTKLEGFEQEVERWITEGILIPCPVETDGGLLATMAVEQPTKQKTRPVLDFRELNDMLPVILGVM